MLKKILVSALIVAFAIYLWTIRQQLAVALDNLRPSTLAALVAILLFHWIVRACRDRVLLKALGYSTSAVALFWVNCAQIALNYLPFKAGTLSSAGFLKARHSVLYRDFAVTFIQQYLLLLFGACILALLALLVAPALPVVQAHGVAIVLAVISLGCMGILAWDGFWKLLPNKIRSRLDNSSRGLHVFREAPRAGLQALLLSLLMAVAAVARVWLLFSAIHHPIGISGAALVSAAMQTSLIVSITPAGLGITEAAAGLTAKLALMGTKTGVLVAAMDRMVILLLAVLLLALRKACHVFFPSKNQTTP
jgi:uncharacterized membrane protein YbhN (UPF0104 family)